jgi:23S rRNA pseudouridine2605 synthase
MNERFLDWSLDRYRLSDLFTSAAQALSVEQLLVMHGSYNLLVDKLRLNQALAKTGFCSRRKADELIAAGRVSVNGEITRDFSVAIDPNRDILAVDKRPVSFKNATYILLNKPPGVVTTRSDEQGRKTVMDLLPDNLRHLRPAGRLDMYSEGLLILTNDGDFAQKLTHPSHHLPKLYRVTVKGFLKNADVKQIRKGVTLEDGPTLPAQARILERNKSYSEVELTIREGRNRQIRRMFEHLGYTVSRLARLAIGRLQLGQVPSGTWRFLTSSEVTHLLCDSSQKSK